MPDIEDRTLSENTPSDMFNFWMQLAAISVATQQLFLGSVGLGSPYSSLSVDKWVGQPSFLEIQVGSHGAPSEFVWGDVLKGIEEMSHNVTAALLSLNLGTMSAECVFDQQVVVYQYSSFVLWVPYGVSHFSLLSVVMISLFSPICFIDGLGCCSTFIHCCCHNNGEK